MKRSGAGALILLVLCVAVSAPCVQGQTARDSSKSIPLVSKTQAIGLGLALAATLAIAPSDEHIAQELQEPHFHASRDFRTTARDLAFFGGPGPFLLGAGLFASGEIVGVPRIAGAGLHLTESVLLAAGVTGSLKGLTGRALPNADPSESDDFGFARGFRRKNGKYVSFPSGHEAAAFATATAITSELDDWRPGLKRYVEPVAYGLAGAIGLARMYQNQHWASDMPLAIAIGIWSGTTVEAHAHRRAQKRLNRLIAHSIIAPLDHNRIAIGWSLVRSQ